MAQDHVMNTMKIQGENRVTADGMNLQVHIRLEITKERSGMTEIDRDGEVGIAQVLEQDIQVEEEDRSFENMMIGMPHRDAARAAPEVPHDLQVAVGVVGEAEETFGLIVRLEGHH